MNETVTGTIANNMNPEEDARLEIKNLKSQHLRLVRAVKVSLALWLAVLAGVYVGAWWSPFPLTWKFSGT